MSSNAAGAQAAPTQKPFQTKLVLLGEAAVGKSSVVLRFVSNEFQENKQPTIGAAFLTQKCRLEDKIIKFEIWDTAGQERFHSLAPMYYRNAQASAVIYDITKAVSILVIEHRFILRTIAVFTIFSHTFLPQQSSFDKAKSWVKELQRQANPNIVIALVGNKIDLLQSSDSSSNTKKDEGEEGDDDEEDDTTATNEATPKSAATQEGASTSSSSLRAVPKEEAKAYADEAGLLFFETSAKTGEGVIDVFTEIAKKINPQDIQQQQQQQQPGGAQQRAGGANAGAQGNVNLADGQQQRRQDACNC